MNVNPFQLIQLIKNGNNPQQLLMSVLQQQGNDNPILNNAMNLAQRGDTATLQMIAKNIAQQRGIDYNQAWAEFKKYFN